MKKAAGCILALAIILMAGGCGFAVSGDAGDKAASQAASDTGAETAAKNRSRLITVGLSQVGSESDWRMASTDSVREAFSPAAGFDLVFKDAQQKQENQLKAVREFIDQGVDYIVLDPIVESGWDSVLLEAKEAGIPVIVYDRRIDVEDDSLYTCWIGSDFRLEGERACEWLSEYLKSRGITRNINIVDIQGTPGASAQLGRSEALETAVMQHKNWYLLGADTGDFTTAKGKEVMNDMLDKHGRNINVVYAENDNIAYGAIDALIARGYEPGLDVEQGEILVLSFDATKEGMQLTLDGKIAVNTECNPLYGPRLAQIVYDLADGKEVEKETFIEEEQFSGIGYIGTIQVRNRHYPVTHLTKEILDERVY